ncbi:hypothetical protein Y597_6041 [Burkholderia pseudomallei MSHR1000]|nr:hypothetical protein Y597_6041 [Burkholderia pseudomallei MSHR1000]
MNRLAKRLVNQWVKRLPNRLANRLRTPGGRVRRVRRVRRARISNARIERARRIGASIQPIESRSRFRAVPRMRDFKAFLKQQRRARRPRRAPQQAHEPA